MNQTSKSIAAALAAVACACAAASCSSRSAARTEDSSELEVGVRLLESRGVVEAMAGDRQTWQKLGEEPLPGVRRLRTRGSGARVDVGGARLWLRAASEVALERDGVGAIVVDLVSGDARLDLAGDRAGYVKAGGALVQVSGRDVLLRRSGDAPAAMAFTSERPERAAWSLAIEAEGLDEGFGRLETRAPGADGSVDLELKRVDVSVTTSGGWAHTEVEHVFHNASSERLEGTFRFPVPAGAMVESLAMEINGRLMEGEIVEKEKARRTYESIVDNMLDPALLEWEHGNWFKLRVFPIEPEADKRVIIRYVSPLRPVLGGHEYRFTAAAAGMQERIDHFALSVDGRVVETVKGLDARREIAVPVSGARIPAVAREARGDGVYTAVRVRPDWSAIAAPAPAASRRVMILFDTSRSALEGRALALDTLDAVLAELAGRAEVAIATVDLEVTARTEGFVAAGSESIKAAVAAIRALDMDGASDLGAAFAHAGDSGATSVIYIGDGTATWGVTGDDELTKLAKTELGSAPLFAALIGKGTSERLWSALAGRTGGRTELTKTPLAARRFAFFAARAPSIKRIDDLVVTPVAGAVIYPSQPTALFEGDELVVLMRQPAEAKTAALEARGRAAGKPFAQKIALAGARDARWVAQRWAARHMAARQAGGADKAEIVALSRDFGILSRHTSLLVLESEEAYREHQIERRRGPEAIAAREVQVTGGDLENLGTRQASLSPSHIQPGDPEIRVPAPADARRVVVIFPFGDTKLAVYDAELDAWIARFLIDNDTADGDYQVTVVITHADGRVERQQLSYTVDTVAPVVAISATAQGDGSYQIEARQLRPRGHRFGRDARRVEVAMPDGQIINLTRTGPGRFARTWTPRAPVAGEIAVTVTATDKALNQSVRELAVAVRSR